MRLLSALGLILTLLSACGVPATSSPSPAPSSNSPTSASVTATPQVYSSYLACMHQKHPDKGYLIIQNLVKSGIYDQNWSLYKVQADNAVKINLETYGKECGA